MFLDLGRFNIHCAATGMVLCGCFRLISGVVFRLGDPVWFIDYCLQWGWVDHQARFWILVVSISIVQQQVWFSVDVSD